MITSDYGRSASDTPHPPTPAAQLQLAAISATSSRIGAVQVSANGHTTSPHKRCAQAPTPINFDDPCKAGVRRADNASPGLNQQQQRRGHPHRALRNHTRRLHFVSHGVSRLQTIKHGCGQGRTRRYIDADLALASAQQRVTPRRPRATTFSAGPRSPPTGCARARLPRRAAHRHPGSGSRPLSRR